MHQIFFILIGIVGVATNASPQIFSLEGKELVSGRNISITARDVVVVFVSAKCPCSNSHVAELAELSKEYSKFKFIGVHSNMDEDVQFAKSYFEKVALPFPIIQDENTKIADHFKALKTPHAFVLNSQTEIIYQGGVTDSMDPNNARKLFLRDALADVKNNRPVRIPFERSLGCAISRR